MKIKVSVTKDILERSRMCNAINATSNCAISRAIIELFPMARTYQFSCNLLNDVDDTNNDQVNLPSTATSFIKIFDNSTPEERVLMSPFSFEIEVPEYVIEKIGLSQIYKVLSESPTLELVMNKEEVF